MNALKEIQREFEKVKAYLIKAQKYKEHADKPWIKESSLARWLYIGSKEVVKDFEKDGVRFEGTQGRDMYQSCILELKSILNGTKRIIERDFPRDCLVQRALT